MNLLEGQDQPDERSAILAKWNDKTKEELLAAKVESDLYIKTLERRQDDLKDDYLKQREELLAKAKWEDLIDRFEKAPKETPVANLANEESQKYDPKEVETIVLNKIKENKIAEKQSENFVEVQNKLQERFGNNYRAVLKEQQSTLGLSDDDVNNLAMKSPSAFFRLMGLDQPVKTENFQTPPRSNQRNDNFAPKGQTKRDWAFYQEMKKTNPTLYLDPKIAVQMHNDVIELGETAFYGQS